MDERKRTRVIWLFRLLFVVTLCLIWGNSLLPGNDSAELSGGMFAWLERLGIRLEDDFLIRKAAHFCEFAALAAELAVLFFLRGGRTFQSAGNAAFGALIAAVWDEGIQTLSPGRGPQVPDVMLDFFGSLAGILFTAAVMELLHRRSKSRGT